MGPVLSLLVVEDSTKILLSLLAFLVISSIWAALIYWLLTAELRRNRWMTWPIAYGVVEKTETGFSGRATFPWDALIRYSYTVNGQHYSGSYRRRFCSSEEAREFLSGFLHGATVPVHFNPRRPRNSEVSHEDFDRLMNEAEVSPPQST